MKKIFLAIATVAMLSACGSSGDKGSATGDSTKVASTANTADAPVMKFAQDVFDFGKIKKGEKVTHVYKFTNTGKSPLIISTAHASCGCTTPTWPKAPIKPGDSGEISVTFDSATKSPGLQDKLVTIEANTVPASSVVHLVGEVLDPNAKTASK